MGLRSQISGLRSQDSVLGCLWVVIGTRLGVFRGVYEVHRGSLGDGSGNPEVPNFLQLLRPSPRNLLDHDLSALFLTPLMIGERHLHALTHKGSADSKAAAEVKSRLATDGIIL